ncbi:hypothetical protein [Schinkia azotoformans]|uniref:hypothetical protein n=1 Tax=Schinkia azotoformans TaxID=1454 RepID=UPI002DBA7414|nr:hypothetical protein [Schinkia azotoformans]MEC1744098.1 hypothetical protein [Schinkia azotoformans]
MTVLAGLAVYTGVDKGYVLIASETRSISYRAILDDCGNVISRDNQIISDNEIKVFRTKNDFIIGFSGDITSRYGHDDLRAEVIAFIEKQIYKNEEIKLLSKKIFDFIHENLAPNGKCFVILGAFQNNSAVLSSFQIRPEELDESIKIQIPGPGHNYEFSYAGVDNQEQFQTSLGKELVNTAATNKGEVIKAVEKYIQNCAELDLASCNKIVKYELM